MNCVIMIVPLNCAIVVRYCTDTTNIFNLFFTSDLLLRKLLKGIFWKMVQDSRSAVSLCAHFLIGDCLSTL